MTYLNRPIGWSAKTPYTPLFSTPFVLYCLFYHKHTSTYWRARHYTEEDWMSLEQQQYIRLTIYLAIIALSGLSIILNSKDQGDVRLSAYLIVAMSVLELLDLKGWI